MLSATFLYVDFISRFFEIPFDINLVLCTKTQVNFGCAGSKMLEKMIVAARLVSFQRILCEKYEIHVCSL